MTNGCAKCKGKIKDSESTVLCSGHCKLSYHTKCVDLQLNEVHALNKCNNIKWFCDNCMPFLDLASLMRKEFSEFKEHVITQLNDFRIMLNSKDGNKDKIENKKSYASAVGEVIVIKPKSAQESKVTKEEIQKKLKPANLEVGITEIKNVKDGGVLIECQHKEEIEKIKSAAEKKLNKKYSIRVPDLKNPCIKIMDIDEELTATDLKNNILKQNQYLQHDNLYINIKTIKKMKSRYLAIVECDPLSFSKILEQGRLSVGWTSCRVFEHVHVFGCYKCGGFDHKGAECDTNRCLQCGGNDHTKDDCLSEVNNCGNCIVMNNKLNLKLRIDHSIFDASCPCYLKKVENAKRKINYNTDKSE